MNPLQKILMNSKLLIPQTPELIEFQAVTFYVTQKFVVVAA